MKNILLALVLSFGTSVSASTFDVPLDDGDLGVEWVEGVGFRPIDRIDVYGDGKISVIEEIANYPTNYFSCSVIDLPNVKSNIVDFNYCKNRKKPIPLAIAPAPSAIPLPASLPLFLSILFSLPVIQYIHKRRKL